MATVTAPQLVSTPVKSTLFMCRRSDLRLVKVPRYPQFGIGGQKVGEQKGEAIQFVNGRFDVPDSGKVTLDDGRTADAQEILQWLKSHPLLGNVEEGMWVVDQMAPPVSVDEMKMLNRLSMNGDEAAIEEFISQERAGWDRADLIEAAQDALGQVREITAALEAQQSEDEAPKPKGGK